MTIEILNLVLSAIQVIQGFREDKKAPQQFSADLRKLMDTLAPLYSLLHQTKNIHDFLETVSSDLQNLSEDVVNRRESNDRLSALAKSLCRRIKANPHSLSLPNVVSFTQEDLESANLSPATASSLSELMSSSASAKNSLLALNRHFGSLCAMVEISNFGRDFQPIVVLANDMATQAKFDADKIIFHLVPVLTDLFQQTRIAVR